MELSLNPRRHPLFLCRGLKKKKSHLYLLSSEVQTNRNVGGNLFELSWIMYAKDMTQDLWRRGHLELSCHHFWIPHVILNQVTNFQLLSRGSPDNRSLVFIAEIGIPTCKRCHTSQIKGDCNCCQQHKFNSPLSSLYIIYTYINEWNKTTLTLANKLYMYVSF